MYNIGEKLKEKLLLLPEVPGSYQMKNKDGNIIYVGKAKNLKRRVNSYFNRVQTGKTLLLVKEIDDFEYIVTSTEIESLILEITLIKKYNPKYNILLKDDKTYPFIELTLNPYPSLKVVRNVKRKKKVNKLFGPYPNVKAAKTTVEMLNRVYPLKKCNGMPKKECLYYHIGECLGYCINKNVDTTEMVKEIISFLNGNHEFITKRIRNEMDKASENMNYEKALELREMLNDIEITLKKQKIDLNIKEDFDVINYYNHNNYLTVVVFFIRNGILFGRNFETFEYCGDVNDNIIEYLIKFYENNGISLKHLIVPKELNIDILQAYLNVKVTTPQKGKIKKLLDMASDNAKAILNEKEELLKKSNEARYNAIKELESALNMDKIYRIEAFDNSHLFGTFYVAGMVVFDEFVPNKNEYRKYKINSEVKDDISAMREVIYRRYYKVLMENLEKPDLIIVDGGKAQIRAAKEIIESLNLNIKVVGLAKDDKHKTNVLIDSDLNQIELNKGGNLFLFLNKIQDEVHRYTISYHRNIKSKGALSSMLDLVDGIGEVRKKELLKRFGSLKKMKEASIEDLNEILPNDIAKKLYNYLEEME